MKRVFKYIGKGLLIIIVAFTLGLGSLVAAIYIQEKGPWGKLRNAPWETNLDTGSAEAGPYTRAKVALFGTLALDPSEVVYYIAFNDSKGQPLDCECNYRLEGEDPGARWWSVTVYKDFHFIPNDRKRYSYSKTNIVRDKDGRWIVKLSSKPQEGNWIPLGDGEGKLILALRLYNPDPSVIENLDSIDLPSIIREGCR